MTTLTVCFQFTLPSVPPEHYTLSGMESLSHSCLLRPSRLVVWYLHLAQGSALTTTTVLINPSEETGKDPTPPASRAMSPVSSMSPRYQEVRTGSLC